MLQTEDASVCCTLTSVEGGALVGSVVADFVMNTTSFYQNDKQREGGSGKSNSLPKATSCSGTQQGRELILIFCLPLGRFFLVF